MASSRNRPAPGTAAPGQPHRALRIGVILGGKIIEERLVREREDISIGQSTRNTFSVPVEGLPRQWPLFVVQNGTYTLRFSDKMDGRVSDGRGVHTLDSLKDGRIATRSDDHWVIPLQESSRGKLIVGSMTLLFQFVAAPPVQPRPRLPASVRGTLADRIDRRLATIMSVSLLLHLVVAIWALTHDQVVRSRIEELHGKFQAEEYEARAVSSTFDMPETPSEKTKKPAEKPGTEEPKTEPKPKPKTGEGEKPKGGDGAPSDAELEEAIADTAFLKVATGAAGEGGRYGEMLETDQGADLNKAIENVKKGGGRVSAGGSASDRRTRGPKGGEIGSGSGAGGVEGPGDGGGVGDKKEEQITSRASLSGGGESLDSTTLDPASVARRIRSRYIRGIKRCHERVLKQIPNAGGRVELDFTVGKSGRVVRADVFGFNPKVDACIKRLTKGWRFGIPRSNGAPSEATFVIPLILRPGN